MSEELKPCPFCGQSAEFRGGGRLEDREGNYNLSSIRCVKCGIEMCGQSHDGQRLMIRAEQDASALAAWNRRTPDLSTLREEREEVYNTAKRDMEALNAERKSKEK